MTRGKAQKTQAGRKEGIATFHERKPGYAPPAEQLKSVPVDSTQPIITAPTPPRPQQLPAQLQHLRGKSSVTQIKLTPVSAVPARRNSPAPIAPLRGQRMASGQIMPFNASIEQLDREMQAHTLAQMGAIMAANEPKVPSTPVKQANGSTHRYTPKSTQRLKDRHPEIAAAREEKLVQEAESKMDVDHDVDMDEDDEDFIVETYIRVPVEQLGIGSKEEQSIGLLVLDSQPDIDQFYGEDDESDSDIYDEEEDENGKSCSQHDLVESSLTNLQPRTTHAQSIQMKKSTQTTNSASTHISTEIGTQATTKSTIAKMQSSVMRRWRKRSHG